MGGRELVLHTSDGVRVRGRSGSHDNASRETPPRPVSGRAGSPPIDAALRCPHWRAAPRRTPLPSSAARARRTGVRVPAWVWIVATWPILAVVVGLGMGPLLRARHHHYPPPDTERRPPP